MTKTLEATYRDGVLKLKEPLDLEPDALVHIRVDVQEQDKEAPGPDWDAVEAFVGFIDEGPEDEAIAENHDDYIYR